MSQDLGKAKMRLSAVLPIAMFLSASAGCGNSKQSGRDCPGLIFTVTKQDVAWRSLGAAPTDAGCTEVCVQAGLIPKAGVFPDYPNDTCSSSHVNLDLGIEDVSCSYFMCDPN
jgi:hypothetical protein